MKEQVVCHAADCICSSNAGDKLEGIRGAVIASS